MPPLRIVSDPDDLQAIPNPFVISTQDRQNFENSRASLTNVYLTCDNALTFAQEKATNACGQRKPTEDELIRRANCKKRKTLVSWPFVFSLIVFFRQSLRLSERISGPSSTMIFATCASTYTKLSMDTTASPWPITILPNCRWKAWTISDPSSLKLLRQLHGSRPHLLQRLVLASDRTSLIAECYLYMPFDFVFSKWPIAPRVMMQSLPILEPTEFA